MQAILLTGEMADNEIEVSVINVMLDNKIFTNIHNGSSLNNTVHSEQLKKYIICSYITFINT